MHWSKYIPTGIYYSWNIDLGIIKFVIKPYGSNVYNDDLVQKDQGNYSHKTCNDFVLFCCDYL